MDSDRRLQEVPKAPQRALCSEEECPVVAERAHLRQKNAGLRSGLRLIALALVAAGVGAWLAAEA